MARQTAVMVDGTTRTSETGAVLNLGGIIPVKIAAATLTAADNGAVCEFNLAAGYTYTLPAVERGLKFRFVVTVTVTSSVARVACATGDFFFGTLMQGSDTTYLPVARDANGTTHLAWEGNGTTTGGIKGDWFDIVGLNDTMWLVSAGLIGGSGTEATPWKTS